MGQELPREHFDPADYSRFARRLEQCIDRLRELLDQADFDGTPASIGAELEFSLMQQSGRPAAINLDLIEALADPRFTPELDCFNLEYNSDPLPLAGRPFSALARQLEAAMAAVRQAAGPLDAQPVMVGILPTLRPGDLGPAAMTPSARYRVLDQVVRNHRGQAFLLNIDGRDPLRLEAECVTFEGANTSFQVHLKLPPERFVRVFNAAQMALGPVLAVAGNSPVFLQHCLWEETRIVVFKQTVDDRDPASAAAHASPRVGLGRGWWQGKPADCLARHLHAHEVLLPLCGQEDTATPLSAGARPSLSELRTHAGTIWHWNRPVYDPSGHLRIEFRALPSGPTIADMLANAALMLGLTLALAEHGPDCARFPFGKVEHNLYRGAQNGLAARLIWPQADGSLRPEPVAGWLERWLEPSAQALSDAGVERDEVDRHLEVIAQRLRSGQTGARWQRAFLDRAERETNRDEALHRMIRTYVRHSDSGEPVHQWPLPA